MHNSQSSNTLESRVSNLFRARATETNSYESLHNKVPIVNVSYMFCSMSVNKTFKKWFFILIHVIVYCEKKISFMPLRATSGPGATCYTALL